MTGFPALQGGDPGITQDDAARLIGVPSIPGCDAGLLACAPGRLCPCGRRAVVLAAGEVA
jgi:hypothetical protein